MRFEESVLVCSALGRSLTYSSPYSGHVPVIDLICSVTTQCFASPPRFVLCTDPQKDKNILCDWLRFRFHAPPLPLPRVFNSKAYVLCHFVSRQISVLHVVRSWRNLEIWSSYDWFQEKRTFWKASQKATSKEKQKKELSLSHSEISNSTLLTGTYFLSPKSWDQKACLKVRNDFNFRSWNWMANRITSNITPAQTPILFQTLPLTNFQLARDSPSFPVQSSSSPPTFIVFFPFIYPLRFPSCCCYAAIWRWSLRIRSWAFVRNLIPLGAAQKMGTLFMWWRRKSDRRDEWFSAEESLRRFSWFSSRLTLFERGEKVRLEKEVSMHFH